MRRLTQSTWFLCSLATLLLATLPSVFCAASSFEVRGEGEQTCEEEVEEAVVVEHQDERRSSTNLNIPQGEHTVPAAAATLPINLLSEHTARNGVGCPLRT